MRTAEELIVDLKKGDITWEEAAREHSACASGPDKEVIPVGMKKNISVRFSQMLLR